MDLELLKENFTPNELLAGNFGIEREGLRVRPDGNLALSKHPTIFGGKLDNPYITTDFSESQVEVVTPPYSSIKRATEVLESLVNIVNNEIRERGELLWPGSMPCIAPDDIPVAEYPNDPSAQEEHDYRLGLIKKYGGLKQLLTGIHFNFSFTENFINKLHQLTNPEQDLQEFKNDLYLKIARNYLRYHWLVIYLTGDSAAMHNSYDCVNFDFIVKDNKESFIMKNGPSIRNSACGYKNLVDLFPRMDNLENYMEDVQEFVDKGVLQKSKELYTQVRLKTGKKGEILESLKENGIQYLEFRTLDLNTFHKSGVNPRDLQFIQLLVFYLLLKDETDIPNDVWQKEAVENEKKTAVHGLLPDLKLQKDGEEITLRDWADEIFTDLEKINKELNLGYDDILYEMETRVHYPTTTYAANMANLVKEKGYVNSMMHLAKRYSDNSYRYRYLMPGYENYELSTQILIKEALTRGIKVDELDPNDNFISLEGNGKKTLVKQATKTELDNYATVLAMENKVVTKKILEDKGIKVPKGEEYNSLEDFTTAIYQYIDQPVVIKPKSTNFGLGIFIFDKGGSEEDLIKAAKKAFEYDSTILVEEFLSGEEYRFLVIGGRTVAVLKRVPANVIGDGESTIRELIKEKNKHPFRGYGYTAPMKKIKLDEQLELFLKNQGLTLESVPEENQRVFLRGNSNISTGGDSIDITDEVPSKFKKVAAEAANEIGAVFCGVDLMIEDINNPDSEFGIIELNFNPSTDMHAYPMEGKEHRTGAYIMSALGLINEKIEDIQTREKLFESFDQLELDQSLNL